jgi:hypothetical protein
MKVREPTCTFLFKHCLISGLENIIVITQKTAITNLLLKVGLTKMSIMLIIFFL